MRGLLVLGCIALGVFLVTASPQERGQREVEVKDEGEQGEFDRIQEIRSTGENRNKVKPPRWLSGGYPAGSPLPRWLSGRFSPVSKLPPTRTKRNTEGKRRKCPGCYSPLIFVEKEEKVLAPVSRKQRDADEHEKLKKKHKHLKEKSHTKKRKHKNHEDRHAHFQAEDAEIGPNQGRRKHPKGKKDRKQHHSGLFSPLARESVDRQREHRRGKDRSRHRSGSLTALGMAPPEMKKYEMDKQDMTE